MLTFLDGPACGVADHLCVRRAPVFLRVVQDGPTWDALDQLDDRPEARESVFAYRRVGDRGTVHVDGRDKKTGRRIAEWYEYGDYKLADPQPDEAVMRDRGRWQAWCQEIYATLTTGSNT